MEEPGAERQAGAPVDYSPCCIPDLIYGRKGGDEPVESIAWALRAGVPVDCVCPIAGRTPLMLCAQKGWLECVRLLLAAGADPRARDEYGRDALMLALIARQVGAAKALAGVSDLEAFDVDGRCPLALAAVHMPHRVDLDLMFSLWRPGMELADDHQGFNALDWGKGSGMLIFDQFRALLRALAEAADLSAVPEGKLGGQSAAWI